MTILSIFFTVLNLQIAFCFRFYRDLNATELQEYLSAKNTSSILEYYEQ